jgi:hypothetical protein
MVSVARHEIVCTRQFPPGARPDHARIVEVGLRGEATRRSLREVVGWIERGEHEVYMTDPSTGQPAEVALCRCPGATWTHIKTWPNATRDDNLDSLPRCP